MRAVAILLISTSAVAASVMPSINSVPILWSSNPQYHEATIKLQEALLLQSGISKRYESLASYVDSRVNVVENKVMCKVEEYAPLPSKHVLFLGALMYGVSVKRFTQTFKLMSNINQTVTVGPDHASTGVRIDF